MCCLLTIINIVQSSSRLSILWNKILTCDHSVEITVAILSHGIVSCAKFYNFKFRIRF